MPLLQSKIMVGCVAIAIFLAGCTSAENIGDPQSHGQITNKRSPQMAIINYTKLDLSNTENLVKYSQAEILITTAVGVWCEPENDGKLAEMRALNPNLKIVGYVNAHASWLMWDDAATRSESSNTYGWDWYHATKDYWSYTTTGDTMMSWPGKVLLNILDPACRTAMVEVFANHWYSHENVLDGVFWDHFNRHLWVPDYIPGVEGEMDLDGDGIAHRDDPDEIAAYLAASESLIEEFRDVLGDHVIQIVNGGRAARDSVFASKVDGMMYENFPEVGFSQGDMRLAFDLNQSNNLFAARQWPRRDNGGPWLILSNKYRGVFVDENAQRISYRFAEFNRVAAAITGCLVSYHPADQSMSYDWPDVELDLGEPVGDVVFVETGVSRNFVNGAVELTFSEVGDWYPFDFQIIQAGESVQSFAYPSHFP